MDPLSAHVHKKDRTSQNGATILQNGPLECTLLKSKGSWQPPSTVLVASKFIANRIAS